ncbi:MAG: glutamate racemase [Candidatus Daviesbacteria bacterium]|nr:glutamate racemase [Candidatus Daviesbacteria bacterium]
MNNQPIGIFDSGIGGLTVAKEIIKTLPRESLIYVGDTARVPYGNRSKELVAKFATEMANFLLRRNVKFLVIACNTISAVAYTQIRDMSPVPVIGVIRPAVIKANQISKNGKIGVIGTVGTIKSDAYGYLLRKFNTKAKIISIACPLFVPLAEEGLHSSKATKIIANDYLKDLTKAEIDTLILGCTHYPLLEEAIRETVGESVTIIDSSLPTAEMLKERLTEAGLLSGNKNPTYQFFVTDAPQRVRKVAGRFFGEKLNGKLKKVTLED